MTATLADAGIDYLRVTSQVEGCKKSMERAWVEVAQGDSLRGHAIKPGGVFGFYGQKARHAIWGAKGDWQLLQLSGRFAKDGLKLAREGIQASRIDIQVTMRVAPGCVPQVLRGEYERACSAPNAGHRPREVRLIESRRQAQTVYIGSRASDIFCRMYDKFAESGDEEYKDCVRYEVELKGRASKQLWQHMSASGDGIGFLVKLLVDIFAERGICLEIEDFSSLPSITLKKDRTSLQQSVGWLASQVAPTVAKLTAEWGFFTAFKALFAQALTEHDFSVMMSSWSLICGS